MAQRIGRNCDDCENEVVGTCAAPLMEVCVGLYEDGEIEQHAQLPRFGWDIFCHYEEKIDELALNPLPRAELCAKCWEKCLSAPGAIAVMTRAELLIVERKAHGIPPEGRPEPEQTVEEMLELPPEETSP